MFLLPARIIGSGRAVACVLLRPAWALDDLERVQLGGTPGYNRSGMAPVCAGGNYPRLPARVTKWNHINVADGLVPWLPGGRDGACALRCHGLPLPALLFSGPDGWAPSLLV